MRGRILHTPRYEPVDTVLDVIKASRAVVVLAHPSVYHSMELARELIAAGGWTVSRSTIPATRRRTGPS